MKLLKLSIKNFISIKSATLDFTKFKTGVFLISGATGSGKSTILDAIHWALYGTLLNQNRNAVSKTIYSDFAGDKDEVNVELTFEQFGTEYRVIRAMKKEGGTTIKFHTPNMIYDKIREGNAALEQVIGLSSKQFDAMVMLEQGNFSKFLLADSKDRASLLRNVFDTQIFRDTEQRFKEKCDDYKQQIDGFIRLEQTYLHGETVDTIKSRIELAVAGKADNDKQLQEYRTELAVNQELLPKLHDYNMKLQLWNAAQAKLAKLQEQYTQIERIQLYKSYWEQYKNNIILHDKSVALNKEITDAQTEIKKLQQELWDVSCKAVSDTALNECKQKVDLLQERFNKAYRCEELESKIGYAAIDINVIVGKLQDAEQALTRLKQEQSALLEQIPVRERYEHEVTDYQSKLRSLQDKQNKLNSLNTQIEQAKPDYVASLKTHLLNICEPGICPICGTAFTANTHEQLTGISFDKFQQLQAEKQGLELWIAEQGAVTEPHCDVTETAAELKAKLKLTEQALNKTNVDVNKLTTDKVLREKDVATYKEQLKQVVEFKQYDARTVSIELEIVEQEYTDLKVAYDAYKASETKIQSIKTKIESWKHLVELKKEEFTKQGIPTDPDTINEGLEYRIQIDDYERNQNRYIAEVERFNTELEQAKQVVKPEPVADITALECQTAINKLTQSIENLIKMISNIDNQINNDTNIINNVMELRDKKAALLPKYKEYSYIYNQISGKNQSKLSLENFILHRQLEWILDTSNRFLATLSNNQFILNIKWESAGRSQGGLEISILDKSSGKARPAQTFSGGELFVLSLSLSLGLMSSIDSLFSGLDINLLFVDEGFGSLDMDCLSRVLGTLQQLKNIETVGIISHVQELIDTIPQGFIVDKGLQGTTIKQFGV